MPVDFGMVPWKHHVCIFSHCKSVPEALFYIGKPIQNGWSRPELAAEIDANLYGKQGNAVTNFEEKLPAPYGGLAKAILKSPYNFRFIDKKNTSEQQLEDELAGNITRFLLELGQGFAYVGRQIELTMPGGQSFIPDMVFYHTRLRCYIVLELKVVPFMPEFAGKLNFYVSAVDGADVATVRHGVPALHGFLSAVLGGIKTLLAGNPTNGGGVEKNFRTLHRRG